MDFEYFPERKLSIVSAPFSGGQPKGGVDKGPEYLLGGGLEKHLQSLNWETKFDGHLEFPVPESDEDIGKMKRPRYVAEAARRVYKSVSEAAVSGRFVLTIGGDHSIAIGTVAGVREKYPDACLIWVDAHCDLNTPSATDSGNLHGCPLSWVTGLAKPEKDDPFGWVPECLDFKNLAYIALRDVDDFEKKMIKDHNITAYSMHHVDKYGIGKVVEMALQKINPDLSKPIHLSFDVDAMDPFFAPSTGTPVRGGLTWREACYICEELAATGKLVAMDLVECNPALGASQKDIDDTISAGISLAKSACGDTLL